MYLKQAQACIDDCTAAIHLLKSDDDIFDLQCDIMNAMCPQYVKRYREDPSEGLGLLSCLTRQRTQGNDLRTLKNSVMARVLTRRGTAHCMLGDLQNAVDDFSLVRRKEALDLILHN